MSSRPSRGAARLAAILDALPDALVLVNANGTVVNANTIALEAFEAPGTALVGRGLLDLLPQFDSRLIPGSMRRPDHMDPTGRTKPTRMVARRTDGSEFPVEVTSANLENGQQAYDGYGYTGDELLMIVVRDLSGTVDTEAELARSQRQTEMILRAAAEGVVGTDTDGRIVLVNPAAAQILGYRAGELGGKELHTLMLHSRADGSPFPYEESPLADTLRSGRKHRVRGQVLWSKGDKKVPVDLTTAPVRDGDQLVGAVMTFTDRRPFDALVEEKAALEKAHAEELERLSEEHASDLTALRQQHVTEVEELREKHAEELAAGEERYAALAEREKDRYEALAGRHEQLLTLLGQSLRGPLDELRRELSALAADDAGQLWPEANQVLHHLSAGYSRITTLIDNVLGYQRLDAGSEDITRTKVMLDAVVAAGVDGAVELIGPGRVQFAVHAPPIEAEVDPQRLATALAHLVADVAGVDATGNTPVSAGGYLDSTVVVAAAQRGEVARIEVRGPYAGGDPVHEPIVRGIVRAHGGVLQTHEVPGMSGSAYVLEVPLGGGAGAVAAADTEAPVAAPVPDGGGSAAEDSGAAEQTVGGGRRRGRRASTDAFLESDVAGPGDAGEAEAPAPTGRRRRRAAAPAEEAAAVPAEGAETASGGTGRRRGRPAETGNADSAGAGEAQGVAEGAVVTAAEQGAGAAASGTGLGGTVPPQGVPVPTGRRARRGSDAPQAALPPALPAAGGHQPMPGAQALPGAPVAPGAQAVPAEGGPVGRRRALAAAAERAAAQEASGTRTVFALPPAEADRSPQAPDAANGTAAAVGAAVPVAPGASAPVAPDAGVPMAPDAGVPMAPGAGVPVAPGAPAVPGAGPAAPGAAAGADGRPQGGGPLPGALPLPGQVQVPAQMPLSVEGVPGDDGRHDAVPLDQADDHTPPQPHPTSAPTGRRRRAVARPAEAAQAVTPGTVPGQAPPPSLPDPLPTPAAPGQAPQATAAAPVPGQAAHGVPAQGTAGQGIPVQAGAVQTGQVQAGPVPSAGQPSGAAQPAVPADPATQPGAPGRPATTAPPTVPAQGTPPQVTPPQATPAHGTPGPAPAPMAPAPGTAPRTTPAQGTPAQPAPPAAPAPQPSAVPGPGTAAQPAPAPVPQQPAPAQPGTPPAGTPVAAPGALPLPAEAGQVPAAGPQGAQAVPVPPGGASAAGVPQQWPNAGDPAGTGTQTPAPGTPAPGTPAPATPAHGTPAPGTPAPGTPLPAGAPGPVGNAGPAAGQPQRAAQPLPAEAAGGVPVDPDSTQGRAISVRTLGQGVPFARQAAQVQQPTATPPPHAPGGSGRRRKLGTPPDPATRPEPRPDQAARPHPPAEPAPGQPSVAGQPSVPGQPPLAGQPSVPQPAPAGPVPVPQPSLGGQSRSVAGTEGAGRSYAIGAPEPDAAEGPEPLDGPGGAVEVADTPRPQPLDDELPPEPLDNPRRLLVWPAPDVTTQQALSDRGYRPVVVHSREEVDAQIAAFPAALFVDPLTGPITRTALQSLRQAAVAAEVPVLVTAGLGQATREAAYGADPAVLLKALAPRDSEQHPPRVLLIEEHAEIALALTSTLERRGMQVARAASDNDAVTLAGQFRPNLVVMDLMQVHRRRAGIVDWLRANGQLNRTPLVVYTAAVDQADLPRLASGETVLFLAERSTSTEVQSRIVDLLARIGTN
ncbi:histidine kinase [Streptomyces sp. FBKL.4005]|uniref:hybrid sensor histidine kinase/response regulator n=1 Tax=Streptomyces sp. FBKL.4005 TaxID=2015515 RepID=UPI000B967706|nr:PAS domain-containing protein [Streptomyces sp. FBKL.4005]OYP16450.1 histidine kinase [Streptomyces sp. FBKL.4005]